MDKQFLERHKRHQEAIAMLKDKFSEVYADNPLAEDAASRQVDGWYKQGDFKALDQLMTDNLPDYPSPFVEEESPTDPFFGLFSTIFGVDSLHPPMGSSPYDPVLAALFMSAMHDAPKRSSRPKFGRFAFAKKPTDQKEQIKFREMPALVEIMGHVRIVGKLSSVSVAGTDDVMLVVRTQDGRDQFIGRDSIYRITELRDHEYEELKDVDGLPFELTTIRDRERREAFERKRRDDDMFSELNLALESLRDEDGSPMPVPDGELGEDIENPFEGLMARQTYHEASPMIRGRIDDSYLPADFMDEPPIEEEEVHSPDNDEHGGGCEPPNIYP